jgi:acetylornithine deacetylase/succinyl-diaminopimelate desuccinylase-like protein
MANGQDPHKALEKLIAHLKAHTPPSMRLIIEASSVGGAALTLSADAPWIQHARHVLTPLAQKDVAFAWEGGSIPIVSTLAKLSGATPVLVGFGLEEDRIHAPNESFGLEQLRLGFLYVASFLSQSPPTL